MTSTKGAAPTGARRRRPRGSLSREEILRGTLLILERDGLNGLSMPALAKQLNAGVTSIYWYFRTKDDLLAAVAEIVTDEVAKQLPMVGTDDWAHELGRYFMAYRNLMHTRPVYREVMVYHPAMFRKSVMTSTVHLVEAALELLVEAGMTPLEASDAFAAYTDYTRGFISIEHSRDAEPAGSDLGLPSAPLSDYATLTPAQRISAIYGLDNHAFASGIALLTAGIREEAARPKHPNRRARASSPASPAADEGRPVLDPHPPVPPKRKARRARGSLSQEEILAVAEQLIQANGLRGLSMPILAKHLGAGVTSIYWYFRSKDDLLVALAERVTAQLYREMPVIGEDDPWDETMLRFFTAYRTELLRSPVYLELAMIRPRFVFSQPAILPLVSDTIDRFVTLLTRAGLTPGEAAMSYQTCSTYTLSFAMLAHGFDDGGHDNDFRARLNPAQFPVFSKLVNTGGTLHKGERQFQAGMRILVDGTRAMIDDAATKRKPRAAAKRGAARKASPAPRSPAK